jgi:hypothetical protein
MPFLETRLEPDVRRLSRLLDRDDVAHEELVAESRQIGAMRTLNALLADAERHRADEERWAERLRDAAWTRAAPTAVDLRTHARIVRRTRLLEEARGELVAAVERLRLGALAAGGRP